MKIKLEEHTVESSSGEYSRKVWLAAGVTGEPRKLCLFLDAEYYLEKMDILPALLDLQAKGAVPPLALLFVSHVNGNARHSDYTCNPRYARYIARDIVPWAHEKNRGISQQGNLICGLSLSGLASAHLTLLYPDLFPYALCQSGSFWWNKEWLRRQARSLSTKPSKLWLSVGDKERETGISYPPSGMLKEVSQIEAAEKLTGELKDLGCDVNFHLFSGDHELKPWEEEIPSALQWLIGKAPKEEPFQS